MDGNINLLIRIEFNAFSQTFQSQKREKLLMRRLTIKEQQAQDLLVNSINKSSIILYHSY